jgi:hypothetical protein
LTSIELPEEYADWVEVEHADGSAYRVKGPFLRLVVDQYMASNTHPVRAVMTRYFAPPKPKPTLPDVGVGGVLRFKGKDGETHRAIANYDGFGWCVYGTCGKLSAIDPGTGDVAPGALWNWTDEQLLAYVNDDGFTVELGGLE